jgi:DNA-binding response OmpR family regulator
LANVLPKQGGATARPQKTQYASSNCRVLIVEDHLDYAVNLMRALREPSAVFPPVKFEIDLAPDPQGALQHIERDDIDVYIVDLKFKDEQNPGTENAEIGKSLVKSIVECTDSGVIVHTGEDAEENAVQLLLLGADDYIEKLPRSSEYDQIRRGTHLEIRERGLHEIIKAKVVALWRRVQLTRAPRSIGFAHTDRVFLVGDWNFVIGSRDLKDSRGETIRISATEASLLRHLCVVENHEIDIETFNISILGRSSLDKDKRIDNYIYRIRNRLGPSVQITSKREGVYKLIGVKEITSQSLGDLPPIE